MHCRGGGGRRAKRTTAGGLPVGLTSAEYTSLPTIGQKGTFGPSSELMARASAVYNRAHRHTCMLIIQQKRFVSVGRRACCQHGKHRQTDTNTAHADTQTQTHTQAQTHTHTDTHTHTHTHTKKGMN